MTGRDPTTWLIAALAGTAGAMVLAAAKGFVGLIVLPAAIFALAAVAASMFANAPDWHERTVAATGSHVEAALRRNARTLGAAYAWGAVAMQGLYLTPLTGLRWQHGWQYALAFAVLAAIAFEFSRLLGKPDASLRAELVRLAVPLTIGQGVLAAGGLAFLTLSGKLLTRRADWAANQVFLFAALAVMVLAAVALRTHARLMRDG